MSRCVLADRRCPETADAAKSNYCPLWVDAIPEVRRDGSGTLVAEEIYRGCFLRRLPLYLVGVTASAGQAAASADACRGAVQLMAPDVAVLGRLVQAAMDAAPLPEAPERVVIVDGNMKMIGMIGGS